MTKTVMIILYGWQGIKIHLDAYKKFGFSCVRIPAGSIEERVKLILEHVPDDAD